MYISLASLAFFDICHLIVILAWWKRIHWFLCSEMTQQWSDRSAMLNHKTLPTSGPLSYLHGSALKTWTSYWKREGSAGMDTWNTPMVQSRQTLTYRLLESVGLGGPRWLGSSWQRGGAESGSSQLSTLMIETSADLGNLAWVQQASYLEGGPLLWILPLYLHINNKRAHGPESLTREYRPKSNI